MEAVVNQKLMIEDGDRDVVEQLIDQVAIRRAAEKIASLSAEAALLTKKIEDGTIMENERERLKEVVSEGYKAGQEYLRVWSKYATETNEEETV